jgi:hypothetical protein
MVNDSTGRAGLGAGLTGLRSYCHKVKFRRDLMNCLLFLVLGILLGAITARKYVPVGASITESMETVRSGKNSTQALRSVYDRIKNFNQVEYSYQSTFRNCLGSSCFNAPVTTDKGSILRVGILGMQASGTQSLLNILQKLSREDPFKIEVIADTHVPPYGYGKNHGWSSIVRISRRIVQHSYSLVRSLSAHSADSTDLFMDLQVNLP